MLLMFKMADDSTLKNNPSFSQFIVQQARQRNLLGNERTTLLSHQDELKLIQYCLARHNKETNGLFHADPEQSCHLLTAMKQYKKILLEKILESKLKRENENSDSKSLEQYRNSSFQPDDDVFVMNESSGKRLANLNSIPTDSQCSSVAISSEKLEEWGMAKFVAQKLALEGGLVDTILKVFHEHVQSSNHITLMDVYERFVSDFLKTGESNWTESVKSSICGSDIYKYMDINGIQCLILNVLNQTECKPLLNTYRTQSESIIQADLHDAHHVMSTPKTPRISKTVFRANESTPGRESTSFNSTPTIHAILPSTPQAGERQEVQKRFIENVFQCYLHLLVNPRCEVALATIFNIPERELSHDAFTHLKHLATNSSLSMFQTLSTFLMRIRLGGQGYAPSSDEPLLDYVKGLGCLFDVIDRMQTVMEENPQPRSVCRILINIIKCNLSGCRSGRFPRSVVEMVAENIFICLSAILEQQQLHWQEGDVKKPVSNGGSLSGQKSLLIIRDYLDISATTFSPIDHYMLFDVRFSEDTPTRFPSFFSKYKSPIPVLEESPEGANQKGAMENVTLLKQNGQRTSVKASEALFLDGSIEEDIICTPCDSAIVPSKTIVHPGPVLKDWILHQKAMTQSGKRKTKPNGNHVKIKPNQKREKKNAPLEEDTGNLTGYEKSLLTRKTSFHDKGKSCRRKLLVQIKGQSKITGFFRL